MSSPTDLVFIGATALPETHYLIHAINQRTPGRYRVTGVLDDHPRWHGQQVDGIPVLGPLDLAPGLDPGTRFVYAIGSHRTRILRREVWTRLGLAEARFETLIHPSVSLLASTHIGHGCVIHPGTLIGQDAVLEGFNVVFANTVVASRNVLRRFALVTSLVALSDEVEIGECAFVGTGSCVAEGVRIGPGAMVAMGSVVYRDLPPGVLAMGNPLRLLHRTEVPADLLELWASRPRIARLVR